MSSTTVKGEGSMMRCRGIASPCGMFSPMMHSKPGLSSGSSRSSLYVIPERPHLPLRASGSRPAASSAASRCGLVTMPIQGPLAPSRTGKWLTWLSSSALRTAAELASGGSTASRGRCSHKSSATLLSSSRGASPSSSGSSLRRICSSSWPRGFSLQLMLMDTATPSITMGASVMSFTHSTTIRTADSVICLKPQSIAALPTMA
mmetsp:Transcript_55791/g.163078  ORF Transcript_55791/g.163078 Transcript_55791/m.163078 type:complete len:204 (+) Transcript_55791:203-814(+)